MEAASRLSLWASYGAGPQFNARLLRGTAQSIGTANDDPNYRVRDGGRGND